MDDFTKAVGFPLQLLRRLPRTIWKMIYISKRNPGAMKKQDKESVPNSCSDHWYYPTANVYYEPPRNVYFYFSDGRWVMAVSLPSSIRLDMDESVTLELVTTRP
jgi:hypothetical protein